VLFRSTNSKLELYESHGERPAIIEALRRWSTIGELFVSETIGIPRDFCMFIPAETASLKEQLYVQREADII
jgi:hypothetical protein